MNNLIASQNVNQFIITQAFLGDTFSPIIFDGVREGSLAYKALEAHSFICVLNCNLNRYSFQAVETVEPELAYWLRLQNC